MVYIGFEEFSASDIVFIGFEVIYIGFEVVYIGFEAVWQKNLKKVRPGPLEPEGSKLELRS